LASGSAVDEGVPHVSHQLVHLLEEEDVFTAVCSCSWTSSTAGSAWDAGQLWGRHRSTDRAEEHGLG